MKRYIANGAYHIENTSKDDFYTSTRSVNVTNDDDFSLEATFHKTHGNNEDSYGLVWGSGNDNGYYIFGVTGEGKYGVYRKTKDWKDLIAFTEASVVDKENGVNVLRIERKDLKLHFYINEKLVNTLPHQSFLGERMGVYTDSGMNVSVDDFVIKHFPTTSHH